VLIFFGVEHFLYPNCVPGVPLEKIMPAYVPGHRVWPYWTGFLMVAAGVGGMFRRYAQTSFTISGMLMLLLVVVVYLPILFSQRDVEGLNYVADSMMFGGTLLLIAEATVPRNVTAPGPGPGF
jgi:uncharacterized membrane protein